MEPLLKRALLILLALGLFSINGLQAGDRNEENPVKYSNDYKKYGKKVVSMSLKDFQYSKDVVQTFLGDCDPGGLANLCCPYWRVKVEWGFTGPKITCETGGQYKCKENCEEVGSDDPGFEDN